MEFLCPQHSQNETSDNWNSLREMNCGDRLLDTFNALFVFNYTLLSSNMRSYHLTADIGHFLSQHIYDMRSGIIFVKIFSKSI